MHIRFATIADIPSLKSLYFDTITNINTQDYNEAQISAWASTAENIASLENKIEEEYFIVSENDTGIITGFISLDEQKGYLDVLYVHKDFQRMGVASMLLKSLLEKVNQMNIAEITTDASLTAKPFFEKNGFIVIKEQMVVVKGVSMINFKMKR